MEDANSLGDDGDSRRPFSSHQAHCSQEKSLKPPLRHLLLLSSQDYRLTGGDPVLTGWETKAYSNWPGSHCHGVMGPWEVCIDGAVRGLHPETALLWRKAELPASGRVLALHRLQLTTQ